MQHEDKTLLQHSGEFLHNYYTFQSMHDGDHDDVVRIFVGLSELGGLIIYITLHYITLHYITLRGTIFPLPGV